MIFCFFSSSSVDQWEDFSHANILEAEKVRQNCASLRSLVDGILQETANDMKRQKEITDVALERRIAETRDAKEKLEDHLSKANKPQNTFPVILCARLLSVFSCCLNFTIDNLF